jgi:predicted anti-sigma-YlaC factor YlaD
MFGFGDKCHRIRRLVSDRVDGPLSARAEKKVISHLEKCSECREESAFYQELKETASRIERVPPPPYLWERITVGLDEHPWGEEEVSPGNSGNMPGRALIGKIN